MSPEGDINHPRHGHGHYPTYKPTKAPTKRPSPTQKPTHYPSRPPRPTAKPIGKPSKKPVGVPSSEPSSVVLPSDPEAPPASLHQSTLLYSTLLYSSLQLIISSVFSLLLFSPFPLLYHHCTDQMYGTYLQF